MRYFDGTEAAKPTAAAAMNFIANTDAAIFDMRRKGAGRCRGLSESRAVTMIAVG